MRGVFVQQKRRERYVVRDDWWGIGGSPPAAQAMAWSLPPMPASLKTPTQWRFLHAPRSREFESPKMKTHHKAGVRCQPRFRIPVLSSCLVKPN